MPPPGSPSGLGHVMSRWTTGSRTASLVPTTISSTTAARDGTSSSISPGGSCPSITPMGAWVLINGTWYKAFQGLAPARRASPGPPTVLTSSAMVTRLLCAVSTAANHVSKRTSGLLGHRVSAETETPTSKLRHNCGLGEFSFDQGRCFGGLRSAKILIQALSSRTVSSALISSKSVINATINGCEIVLSKPIGSGMLA